MGHVETLLKVGLGLIVTALCLQLVGFIGPAWVILNIHLSSLPGNPYGSLDKMVTNAGVWWVNLCFTGSTIGETCYSSSLHDDSTLGVSLSSSISELGQINWIELAVVTTLALACTIAALVVLVIALAKCFRVQPSVFCGIAIGILIFAGGFLFSAVIKVGTKVSSVRGTLGLVNAYLGYDLITLGDPWACIMDGISIAFIGLAGIVLIVAMCQRQNSYPGQVQPGVNVVSTSNASAPVYGHNQVAGGYMYNQQAGIVRPDGLYSNNPGPVQPPQYTDAYPSK